MVIPKSFKAGLTSLVFLSAAITVPSYLVTSAEKAKRELKYQLARDQENAYLTKLSEEIAAQRVKNREVMDQAKKEYDNLLSRQATLIAQHSYTQAYQDPSEPKYVEQKVTSSSSSGSKSSGSGSSSKSSSSTPKVSRPTTTS